MAFAIGTTVKLVGLPADHPALCNGGHAVVQGVSFYLGKTLYAVKTHLGAQAIFHPIDSSNVTTVANPNPTLPLPGTQAWAAPSHHSLTP